MKTTSNNIVERIIPAPLSFEKSGVLGMTAMNSFSVLVNKLHRKVGLDLRNHTPYQSLISKTW